MSTEPPVGPLQYRPEIDGLRTIAVMSVVLYHADLTVLGKHLLPGGFIGVDIFFVISGYLITSIILRELVSQQTFNFVSFYERRARRILPALLTVMIVSIPFTWFLMLPKALQENSGAVLSSLFFGSNFWFWLEDSYAAEASQLKPFLHTWTLSVEEQFYVLFPLLMIFIWSTARKLTPIIFVLITISSLHLAHTLSARLPDTSFFLLPTRAWELMVGALLAWGGVIYGRSPRSPLTIALPTAGLALIVLAMVGLEDTMRHPSYLTAAPVFGTALIIWFARENEWVTKLLSLKPMIWVGLLSYSIYLWHFPIFALSRITTPELSMPIKLALIGLTLIISCAAYFAIERPMRDKKTVGTLVFNSTIVCTTVFLMTFHAAIATGNLTPNRFTTFEDLIAFRYDYNSDYRNGTCFLKPEQIEQAAPFKDCPDSSSNAEKPVLLIWGDSHAAHLYPGFKNLLGESHTIIQRTGSLCGPIIGSESPTRPSCRELNDSILAEVSEMRPETVVLSMAWGKSAWESVGKTLRPLKEIGIERIVLVGPSPRWAEGMPKQLVAEYEATGAFRLFMDRGLDLDFASVDRDMRAFAQANGVEYMSPWSALCNSSGCRTRVSDGPNGISQWDYGHLTAEGSRFVVRNQFPYKPTQLPSDEPR